MNFLALALLLFCLISLVNNQKTDPWEVRCHGKYQSIDLILIFFKFSNKFIHIITIYYFFLNSIL